MEMKVDSFSWFASHTPSQEATEGSIPPPYSFSGSYWRVWSIPPTQRWEPKRSQETGNGARGAKGTRRLRGQRHCDATALESKQIAAGTQGSRARQQAWGLGGDEDTAKQSQLPIRARYPTTWFTGKMLIVGSIPKLTKLRILSYFLMLRIWNSHC